MSTQLKRVWKFGCRWDETGTPQASIADSMFKKYGVAFAYSHAVLDMRQGDLIVLAEGNTIIAIGEALTPPAEISKLYVPHADDEWKKFSDSVNIFGCKVKYYWLPVDKQFSYAKRGRFFHAKQIEQKVNDLFEEFETSPQAMNKEDL